MGKRKPEKPYTGVLLEPAPRLDPKLPEQTNALRFTHSSLERLFALMDHYGIDSKDPDPSTKWMRLALALALDHVPNFAPLAPEGKPGRRPDPNRLADDVILFVEMIKAKAAGKSLLQRARHLTTTSKRFNGKKPETLRQRFYLLTSPTSPEGTRMREFLARINEEN